MQLSVSCVGLRLWLVTMCWMAEDKERHVFYYRGYDYKCFCRYSRQVSRNPLGRERGNILPPVGPSFSLHRLLEWWWWCFFRSALFGASTCRPRDNADDTPSPSSSTSLTCHLQFPGSLCFELKFPFRFALCPQVVGCSVEGKCPPLAAN